MSRRINKNKSHPGGRRPRRLRLIADPKTEPDIDRIARSMIELATNSAEAETDRRLAEKATQPDPFVCNCLCNCCKLRRLHDGLCPQPSDEQLEEAAVIISRTK